MKLPKLNKPKLNKPKLNEAGVLQACKLRLAWWQKIGVVVHFDRINSGTMNVGGRWIHMARAGSPDLWAFIKRNSTCHVLFIECKATEEQRPSLAQAEFRDRFTSMTNVIYLVAHQPSAVDQAVEAVSGHYEHALSQMDLNDKSMP